MPTRRVVSLDQRNGVVLAIEGAGEDVEEASKDWLVAYGRCAATRSASAAKFENIRPREENTVVSWAVVEVGIAAQIVAREAPIYLAGILDL